MRSRQALFSWRLFAGSASLRNANSNLKERQAWDVLSSIRLFRSLSDDQLREFIAATTVVTCPSRV